MRRREARHYQLRGIITVVTDPLESVVGPFGREIDGRCAIERSRIAPSGSGHTLFQTKAFRGGRGSRRQEYK